MLQAAIRTEAHSPAPWCDARSRAACPCGPRGVATVIEAVKVLACFRNKVPAAAGVRTGPDGEPTSNGRNDLLGNGGEDIRGSERLAQDKRAAEASLRAPLLFPPVLGLGVRREHSGRFAGNVGKHACPTDGPRRWPGGRRVDSYRHREGMRQGRALSRKTSKVNPKTAYPVDGEICAIPSEMRHYPRPKRDSAAQRRGDPQGSAATRGVVARRKRMPVAEVTIQTVDDPNAQALIARWGEDLARLGRERLRRDRP